MRNPVEELFFESELNPVDDLLGGAVEESPVVPYTQELEEMVYAKSPVSKALTDTLKTTGGGIMKALSYLDIPRSVMAAAISKDPETKVMDALTGKIHPSWGEAMPEKIEVPRGEGSSYWSGIKKWEEGDEANLKPAIALTADILADPINFIGVGGLTKLGRAGKALANLNKAYGGPIAAMLKTKDPAIVVGAIMNKAPKVVQFLKSQGVSDDMITLASKAKGVLQETLSEQAKAGQWAAARFGKYRTPRGINEAVAKRIEKTKKTLPNIPLLRKIITGTGDDVWDQAYEAVMNKHREKMRDILDTGTSLRKKIGQAAPEGTIDDMSTAAWFERGGTGPIADEARNLMESQLEEMRQLASRGYDLGVKPIREEGYQYLPHVKADQSIWDRIRAAFNRQRPTTFTPHKLQRDYVWITDPATGEEFIESLSLMAKTYKMNPEDFVTRQATVDEINRWFKEVNIFDKHPQDLFKSDLTSAVVKGSVDNEIALHGARQLEFFETTAQEAIDKVGGIDQAFAMGWRTPKLAKSDKFLLKDGKMIPLKNKMDVLETLPMEPARARFVESKWKEIVSPEDVEKGLKDLYRGYTSLWKRYTLFPFSEYHFRNMVGDIWNGWMNGWKPSQIAGDLVEAAKMQRMGKSPSIFGKEIPFPFKGGEKLRIKSKLYGELKPEQILREAQIRGVVGTGQYGEMQDVFTKLTSDKGKSFLEREFYDLETAMKVGSFLEDNRRLGLFTRQLKNGENWEDAARIVKKTLYDYSDLTDFERSVRRWGIPFYTWYRKNVPAQFRYLMKYPGKVAILPKGKAHIEGWSDKHVAETQRPEWMQREFSIHMGTDPQGAEKFMTLGSFLPTADVFRFGGSPEDFLTGILSNMNPLIKVPFEMSINKNTFFDRPVDRLRDEEAGIFERGGPFLGNERTNWLGMNLPTTGVKASEMLPFTRLLSTLDRMNPFGVFDEGPEYDPLILKEGQIKTRPYHTELETWGKLLKSITGLKVYPVDVERDALYDIKDKIYQGGRSTGFNKAAIMSAIKYALAEGDLKSVEMYDKMLDKVMDRLDEEHQLLEDYLNSKE